MRKLTLFFFTHFLFVSNSQAGLLDSKPPKSCEWKLEVHDADGNVHTLNTFNTDKAVKISPSVTGWKCSLEPQYVLSPSKRDDTNRDLVCIGPGESEVSSILNCGVIPVLSDASSDEHINLFLAVGKREKNRDVRKKITIIAQCHCIF